MRRRTSICPHPLSAYAAGDPRANLYKGVGLELSTATHAEARLIAEPRARGGRTEGASMFVTDFPCPPCAKLIAARRRREALLQSRATRCSTDEDVLAAAGVEVVRVG